MRFLKSKLPALLFVAFIGLCFCINLILPDAAFSEAENRPLAALPKPTWKSVADASFMIDFETYVSDQFFLRSAWVSFKSVSERALLKQDVNQVYLCENNRLITRFPEALSGGSWYGAVDSAWSRLETNMGSVRDFADAAGIPVYFALAPGAVSVWADSLPHNAPNLDQRALIEAAYADAGEAVPVDLFSALYAHRDEDIYYATDHHWTSLGAYYGYRAVCDALGLSPQALPEAPYLTLDGFYGTASAKCGIRPGAGDTVTLYVPDDGLTVRFYEGGETTDGVLYDRTAAERSDKYTVFFGGNPPLVTIQTGSETGKKLLLVKDSYANAALPFLLAHFSEIYIVDLRYQRFGISALIADNAIDCALILYSVPNFVTDPNVSFIIF